MGSSSWEPVIYGARVLITSFFFFPPKSIIFYQRQIIQRSPSFLPSHINPITSQRNDIDFTSVVIFDLDFASVGLWLKLRVSQMDVDSASVQSQHSRMLSPKIYRLPLAISIPSFIYHLRKC